MAVIPSLLKDAYNTALTKSVLCVVLSGSCIVAAQYCSRSDVLNAAFYALSLPAAFVGLTKGVVAARLGGIMVSLRRGLSS